MNVRPKLPAASRNPSANEKVRQALNYATDKNAIIQIVTHGVGTPMKTFMSSATPLHVGNGPIYPYEIDKAKQLLGEAGIPTASRRSMLVLAGNADETAIATALQQMWAPVGVKLSLEQVDNATRTAQIPRRGLPDAGCGVDRRHRRPERDHLLLRLFSHHRGAALGLEEREVDKLFEACQKEIDAEEARPTSTRRSSRSTSRAAPILSIYETPYPVALQKQVKGFVQIPLGNNIFAATSLEKCRTVRGARGGARPWRAGSDPLPHPADRSRPYPVHPVVDLRARPAAAGRPDERHPRRAGAPRPTSPGSTRELGLDRPLVGAVLAFPRAAAQRRPRQLDRPQGAGRQPDRRADAGHPALDALSRRVIAVVLAVPLAFLAALRPERPADAWSAARSRSGSRRRSSTSGWSC